LYDAVTGLPSTVLFHEHLTARIAARVDHRLR
jgi:hypothetical protein